MKLIHTLILVVFLLFNAPKIHSKTNVKTGEWNSFLKLSEKINLPVRLIIKKEKKNYLFQIKNAEETINLIVLPAKNDSLELRFPDFNSSLIVKLNKTNISGYWVNYEKTNYKIPFYGKPKKEAEKKEAECLDGKWECTFDENTPDVYKAIGLFKVNKRNLTGTFLTETGDYRFLEGHSTDDNSFYLSCFDGSHAFLFTGILKEGEIKGNFYSGKHFKGDWKAIKNDIFELRDPTKLTYLVSDESIQFNFLDLEKNNYSFPNSATDNKVVIIQILGTWCPNCLDETLYFKELYSNYHEEGLEIISIGYEIKNDFEGQAMAIKRLKDRHKLPFTFLVGGKADKNLVSKHFPMLNSIISYPTTIYIDRTGNVRKIYTGFSGPGTGEIYTEYVRKNNLFIEKLLAE